MILGFPAGLYLLSLLPIIVLAHLLYQRRVRKRVSSLILWSRLQGTVARRPRLRQLLNIHFLLQCLAVLMAAIALAEPMIPRTLPPRDERQIIIADTSAGMGAITSQGERIAALRREIRAHLSESRENTELTLIELSREPRVRGTFAAGDQGLIDLVETLRATDEEGNPRAALEMATRLLGGEEGTEIHFFTDGAFLLEPGLLDSSALALHLIGGEPEANAGIVAFAPEGTELFLAVEYHGPEDVARELRLLQDDRVFLSRELELVPGERRELALPLPGRGPRHLKGVLVGADALAADDTAYAVIEESRALDVALVSPGNPFLQTALRVHPRVRLREYTQFTPAIEADIFVFDRLGEVALPRGRVLAFATELPGFPAQASGLTKDVTGPLPSAAHPVTEALNFSGTYLAEAATFVLPPEVTPLLSDRGAPIAFAGESRGVRAISFGFDLTASNLPLEPLLPLLVERSIHWLTAGTYPLDTNTYRAGDSVELLLSPGEHADLLRPDGGSSTLRVEELSHPFSATRDAGIYTVRQGEKSRSFAVNLLSSEETNLAARVEPPVERQSGAVSTAAGAREIWRLLAIGALLLALLESAIPRRRGP